MNENEKLSKIWDKIPTDKIYEDVFQPGLKRVGEALATIVGLSKGVRQIG